MSCRDIDLRCGVMRGFKFFSGLVFLMIIDFWKLVFDISFFRRRREIKYLFRFVVFRRLKFRIFRSGF